MMHTSYDDNKKMIQKISDEGKTGNIQIDSIINEYSSKYISKIMNKIINKGLIGGQTSEQPNDEKQPTNKSNTTKPLVSILSASETSITPPKTLTIFDQITGSIDKPVSVSKQSDSTTSSDVFIQADSATSSAVPSGINQSSTSDVFVQSLPAKSKESIVDSATSSAVPSNYVINPSTTSDIFMQPSHAKSFGENQLDMATSSAMPVNVNTSIVNSPTSSENRTTTDIPLTTQVPKADMIDVFGSPKKSDKQTLSPKRAIDLVIKKNELLKEKEEILKKKEEELKNRESLIAQVEQDVKLKIDKNNKEIDELNKIKSELEVTIDKLKDEKKSLDKSLSDIELSLSDVDKLQNTESDYQTNSILKKIFG